ncbi:MAG: Gfo/Idh/MocA family oxidoreductase [Verrucomicrobiae bacterium]|nr:Gfo/Idh/MocA family oxidoreductase [Verrucomicrobiae bacterium]
MRKTLKIGFIGGGLNSAVGATHFIASQMDECFDVVAGCFSRHREINEQTAEKWGIPAERIYDSASDLLEREKDRLDAVAVLTPTPDHTGLVLSALRSGYPVICEKALTDSTADASLIWETQQQKSGFLAVTYNYSGYPMLRELRQMIRQGRFGRIEQVHIEMPQEGFARLDRAGNPVLPQQWRMRDGVVPTISLDLGVHLHHIIDFLTGEKPLELVALQSSQGRFHQVVDNIMCMVRYSNKLDCSVWFSKAALGYRNGLRVRVFGETGSAEWQQMDPEFIICCDNQGHRLIIDRGDVDVHLAHQPKYNRFKAGHPAGFLEAFANLYADIWHSLGEFRASGYQKASEHVFGTRHALEGLIMLEAIARSSEKHQWVMVENHLFE